MIKPTLRRFSLAFAALAWLASAIAAHAAQIVPSTFEAEAFDSYYDKTPGNQGDAGYRTGEDVDVFVSNDPAGGDRIIKNFESGEWLGYTVSVSTGGNYNLELRAATNFDFPDSSYYVVVDDVKVTNFIVLPNTGGWDQYQWIGKTTIALTAGAHVIKIVSVTPYFALNSVRIVSTASPSSYYGAPYAIPGEIEAEAFDAGGESAGYHDNTPGNQGNAGYRTGEDVDIFVTNDAQDGSPYIVKNIEAGDWLAYTISVPTTGDYDVDLRVSTQADFPNPAYHVEVDGLNVTGSVFLPDTGGWDNYQWLGRRTVNLTSGTHVLKVVSERPYFALNALRVNPAGNGEFAHALPGQIEAEEYFRTPCPCPTEGLAFHENTRGNQGDAGFRTFDDVDIFKSNDAGSGSWYVVKNFEAGEWLMYEVNATPGIYTLELRASTSPDYPWSAYHVDVDGVQATGSVVLPDTGGWDNYQWIGTTQVALSGKQYLRIVVDNPYFNLNTLRLTLP